MTTPVLSIFTSNLLSIITAFSGNILVTVPGLTIGVFGTIPFRHCTKDFLADEDKWRCFQRRETEGEEVEDLGRGFLFLVACALRTSHEPWSFGEMTESP